jgi:hypothetical protein
MLLTATLLAMALPLLSGCGGSSSPYRADCELEAERSGFGEDNDFQDNAIKGCEEALDNTHAKPGIFSEEP